MEKSRKSIKIKFINLQIKNLKLIYEEVKEQNPDDCSYAYSGYTPLTFYYKAFQ